ncbi:MAG: hypothetical protein ACMG55_18650, partial [Microcoleus sp.]
MHRQCLHQGCRRGRCRGPDKTNARAIFVEDNDLFDTANLGKGQANSADQLQYLLDKDLVSQDEIENLYE